MIRNAAPRPAQALKEQTAKLKNNSLTEKRAKRARATEDRRHERTRATEDRRHERTQQREEGKLVRECNNVALSNKNVLCKEQRALFKAGLNNHGSGIPDSTFLTVCDQTKYVLCNSKNFRDNKTPQAISGLITLCDAFNRRDMDSIKKSCGIDQQKEQQREKVTL